MPMAIMLFMETNNYRQVNLKILNFQSTPTRQVIFCTSKIWNQQLKPLFITLTAGKSKQKTSVPQTVKSTSANCKMGCIFSYWKTWKTKDKDKPLSL